MQTQTHAAVSRIPAALVLRQPTQAAQRLDLSRSGLPLSGGTSRTIGKGEAVFAEGDRAEFFYKVVSGTIRACKLLSDGRRQIDAFHLEGDIFGLESGEEHRLTAEAVDQAVVVAYRRSRIASMMHEDPELSSQLMNSVITSLERAYDHMVLLGRKSAQEKIATFLLGMANRLARGGNRFELPMQRADIADHLGLTIETVSRTLTQLMRDGLIKLAASGRTVVLQKQQNLESLCA